MLVISGADLVGKTTFAKKCVQKLQEEHGLQHMLHHMSRIPECWDCYYDYIDRMCVTSAWDRFHLDELAYRACDDRHSSMTQLKWSLVEAQFKLRCGFQVVLYADNKVIEQRFAERGDPMYDLDHIKKVNLQFGKICDQGGILLRDSYYTPLVDLHGITDDELLNLTVESYVNRLDEYRSFVKR